jgi:Zn-dependent alcohol dehydrogenase
MESKAAVLNHPTDLDGLTDGESITIETINIDSPTGEEVLVEIGAGSLCHTDVTIAYGKLDESYPMVMGHEGAGIVREVGDQVNSLSPGDHVVLGRTACGKCEFCRQGRSNICVKRKETQPTGALRTGAVRFSRDGSPVHHCHGVSSFTEHTLVTEDVAIKITDELPLEKATLLGCGVFTGAGAVLNTANVEAGSSLAIFGAGGVGLNAVQAAELCGATTIIVVDPIDEKREMAIEFGATHVIDPSERDPVEKIRDLTDRGVDYAFDIVGAESVAEQAIQSIAPLGTAVLVGTTGVGMNELNFDLNDFVTWEKNIVGSFNGSYSLQQAIPMLAELVTAGKLSLDPLITNTRPLEELPQAMVDLETKSEIRQVILPS